MTVGAEGPTGTTNAEPVRPTPGLGAPSYLQRVLASAYQDEPNSVPLTVATPAGLVFGNAVHPATWLRRLAEQLRHLTIGHSPNAAVDAEIQMFFDMADRWSEDQPGGTVRVEDIRWIYFTEALIVPIHAAGPNYTEPACWQVALRDVTAWTIGLPPE
jgi:hypothetical protein